jgi:phosphoketolase
MPDFRDYAVKPCPARQVDAEATRVMGKFICAT